MKKFLVEEVSTKKQRTIILKDSAVRDIDKEYEDYMSDQRTGKIVKVKYKVIAEIN